MQKQTYDVLVIGGGPAGIFAASLAHIKGLKSILIEANDYLGGQPLMIYSQKTIEDYPGYARIKAYQLIDNFIAQLKQTKVSVLLKTKLISYVSNDGSFVINLSNKKKICAKAIIVATGPGMFTPNRLEIPVDKHKNIEYNVNQLDSYKNLNVVILGGGDSAVDWANEISSVAKSVTIIHRRKEFRANGVNVNNLKKHKVKIYLNYEILKVNKNQITFKNNETSKIDKISFQKLIVQYGQSIDSTGLNVFKNLKIDQNKRIPVNIHQMTNLKNIYAIGNICIYDGKPSSIVCAHGEASVAVRHILNRVRSYADKIVKH